MTARKTPKRGRENYQDYPWSGTASGTGDVA